jgi:hypothetical protein
MLWRFVCVALGVNTPLAVGAPTTLYNPCQAHQVPFLVKVGAVCFFQPSWVPLGRQRIRRLLRFLSGTDPGFPLCPTQTGFSYVFSWAPPGISGSRLRSFSMQVLRTREVLAVDPRAVDASQCQARDLRGPCRHASSGCPRNYE